jgi:hypothetical protein
LPERKEGLGEDEKERLPVGQMRTKNRAFSGDVGTAQGKVGEDVGANRKSF